MEVFVDTDVVISSLLSDKGAAFLLFQQKNLKIHISTYSLKESEIVVKRLHIDRKKLNALVMKIHIIPLKQTVEKIRETYTHHVSDINDSHIVAGAKMGGVKFLVTYNVKHYKTEKIMRDFGIIVLTPGTFLQYLRSL